MHPEYTIWYMCTGYHVLAIHLNAPAKNMLGTRVRMTMYLACTNVYQSGTRLVHMHVIY